MGFLPGLSRPRTSRVLGTEDTLQTRINPHLAGWVRKLKEIRALNLRASNRTCQSGYRYHRLNGEGAFRCSHVPI